MVILRDFDRANQYIELTSLEIRVKDSFKKINGWYKNTEEGISAIFVVNKELFLYWKNKRYLINEKDQLSIINNIIRLIREDNVLIEINYRSEDLELPSPFEYIDKDDEDWGLFLKKIINDPERKRNFIENLSQ